MDAAELKDLRTEHGMSQIAMAEMLGVTRTVYQTMEYGEKPIDDELATRLRAWAGGEEDEGEEDELPEPPYDPNDAPDDAEKPRGRARVDGGKRLSAWQEEAAVRMIALLQGEQVELEVDGVKHQVIIPGLTQVVARFDLYDAECVYNGSPALAISTVKIAPRHPWLKSLIDMSSMGGDYREFAVAVGTILVPIAIHHGLFTPPPPPIVEGDPSTNGTGA